MPGSSAEGETPARAEEIVGESSVLHHCDGREGGKADVGVAGRKVRVFSSSGLYFLAEIEAALCPGGAVVGCEAWEARKQPRRGGSESLPLKLGRGK